jgi:hypothetical protein
MKTIELGEDDIGRFGPDEGPGIVVVFLQVAVDGGLEVGDRTEHAAADALAGHLGEEAFNRIEPGPGGWGEVKDPARVAGEPGFDLGMLMGGVIIEDGVDQFAGPPRRARRC